MFAYFGWKYFDDMVYELKDEYCIYHYGETLVPVCKITGLSHEEVLTANKMIPLEKSIQSNGYLLSKPFRDLNLFLFPNGEYCVSYGGNHRVFLAKKHSISLIKARVDVVIPFKLLNNEEFYLCNCIDNISPPNKELFKIASKYKLLPEQQSKPLIRIR